MGLTTRVAGRRERRLGALGLGLLVLLLGGRALLPARARRPTDAGDALSDLRRARGLHRAAPRPRDPVELEALIERHRRVAATAPLPELGAQVRLRAGELAAAEGWFERAVVHFQEAQDVDPTGPHAARACLERAHALRRLGSAERARDTYLAVLVHPRAAPDVRDAALYWGARLAQEAGETTQARLAWERLVREASSESMRRRARERLASCARE